jgi:AcrR family transcriptional regulator
VLGAPVTIGHSRPHGAASLGPAPYSRRLHAIARPYGHAAGFEGRRAEIIDVAARLMAERGYRAVSMDVLGAAVGLGKGALYHYIGSKEHILVAIQGRVLEPLLQLSRPIAAVPADPLVRLRLVSRALLEVMLGRLEYVRVYEHDLRNLRGANRTALVRQRREFEAIVTGLIAEAMGSGTFRPGDPHLATLQFLNLHNRTYEWFDARGPWDAAYLSEAYCRTLFGGLCAGAYDEAALEERVAQSWATFPPVEPPPGRPVRPRRPRTR